MIWATVSSPSCFCWLYRASPTLAAKNTINLISVLGIWWCPCLESSLVLLEEGVCYDQCVLLANFISLWPASFCTPRPNLPVTPGVSWLPMFVFQSPVMKRTSFWGVSSKRSCILIEWFEWFALENHCDIEWFALEMNRDHSVFSEIAPKYCISDSFVDYEGCSISTKGFLPTVVDKMVIWVSVFSVSHQKL